MKISVELPGHSIVENGIARKVTKEEMEEYEKTHEVSELALVEDNKQLEEFANDISKIHTEWLNKTYEHETNVSVSKYLAEYLTEIGYTKQEWISVDEGLPTNDYYKPETERNKYLVYTEPRGIMYEATFGYEEHSWWVTKESIFDRVLSLDFSEYVTHWQPLPQKPKMKGAE